MKLPQHTSLMMYYIIFMSTIMTISSTNLLMIWLCMELNMFSFLPILMNNMSANETEGSINYFLAQALGSMILLMSSIMMFSLFWLKTLIPITLMMALLLKMGAAPCHYWYPTSMEMASWMNCFFLSTWQKITPIFTLLYIILPSKMNNLMMLIISMNALVGGIMGLSQPSLKKVMAYSSITHMSWMLSGSITDSLNLSIIYFLLYSTMTLPLFILLNKMMKNKINDLWSKQTHSTLWTIPASIMLMSLSGMPPLTGFIPKLLMMNTLLNCSIMMTMILILGSLLNLYFYLNISFNILMKNQESFNYYQKPMLISSTMIMLLALNLFSFMIILF